VYSIREKAVSNMETSVGGEQRFRLSEIYDAFSEVCA
jgi:hypothetical protein